tara:strand:+ start:777 stop:1442 length:666 start_codon:yes stop_codon:yes gene_type:complete
MVRSLNKLEKKLNLKFKNIKFLERSLTHKSHDSIDNYEKLEFLGDRILGLTISNKLLEMYPNDKVGYLDKKLAFLVNKEKCFEVGKSLNLDQFILVGRSKSKNIKIENKIISDCCESLIGAIFLDQNLSIAEKFILNNWEAFLKETSVLFIDPKTKLQEYSLKKFKSLPIYKVLENSGPRHKPIFKVAVKLRDSKYVSAVGASKKEAQQKAAKLFLANIGK